MLSFYLFTNTLCHIFVTNSSDHWIQTCSYSVIAVCWKNGSKTIKELMPRPADTNRVRNSLCQEYIRPKT